MFRQYEQCAPRPDLSTIGSERWPFAVFRVAAAILSLMVWISCAGGAAASEGAVTRVLHVDSYHAGNEWNDRIAAALRTTLEEHGIEVRVVHLDTKRRSSEEEKIESALRAKQLIEDYKPDVVTVSDDDAAKYLLMPHFRNAAIPFVFCGLNWDASIYGLPFTNTTGMVEVSPIPQIVRLLRQHARGPRIGFLAEDTETKRKELLHHERIFGLRYEKAYFVSSFAEWKDAFLQAQKDVDLLLALGVGALADWNVEAAAAFAEQVSTIPTGTDFGWLMPVSMIGVAKSPEEQGRWAAHAALRIIDGVLPNQIPLTYNREGELLFNPRIAHRLGVASAPPLARPTP
jgi:ABC-type uncharacterized transport system substrate-binding protein